MIEIKQCEKSCGAIVYTASESCIAYLLVQEKSGFWVFPKGHMEPGETEQETAMREIKEETGLTVRVIDGFRAMDEHTLAREGHPERMKQTVFFLATYEKQDYHPQEAEISQIALMDLDTALATLQLDSFKRILTEADAFLKRYLPAGQSANR